MKEIFAILRPGKDRVTKEALAKVGCMTCTTFRVFGRGKQRGLSYGEKRFENGVLKSAGVRYLPKKLIYLVVSDHQAKGVLGAIVKANQTGQPGDGKIFVMENQEVLRIRTGEKGEAAVG